MATFQIKDAASIAASLVNLMQSTQKKVTDFNIGAIVRSMLEAIADEMDELYQQMFNGLVQSIPVSVYNSFTFPALVKQPASGLIAVSITTQATPTLISAGTVFTSATTANTYANPSDFTIPAGQTVGNVPVVATIPGTASNLAQNTQFSMSPPPTGFASAVNPNAFINGTDDESPADQLIRFNGFISTLQRATDAAIVFGAKTTALLDSNGNVIEKVASALIVEPYLTNQTLSVSKIFCYIFNGVGGTSAALVSLAQNVINGFVDGNGNRVPGYKAAGVQCTAAAATEQPLNIVAALTAKPGFVQADLQVQAIAVLGAYLLALPVGAPAIFALLEALVMAIPGVANFVIATPTADVSATAVNNKIVTGVISIIPIGRAAITEGSDSVSGVGT